MWTAADGKAVGQLTPNPPTLAERVDAAQKDLAAKQARDLEQQRRRPLSLVASQKTVADLAAARGGNGWRAHERQDHGRCSGGCQGRGGRELTARRRTAQGDVPGQGGAAAGRRPLAGRPRRPPRRVAPHNPSAQPGRRSQPAGRARGGCGRWSRPASGPSVRSGRIRDAVRTWIPPATFSWAARRTSRSGQAAETQHKVTLTKGFWMGVHQVTQAQWQAVMGSTPAASRATVTCRW